jgi:hypothetical protein
MLQRSGSGGNFCLPLRPWQFAEAPDRPSIQLPPFEPAGALTVNRYRTLLVWAHEEYAEGVPAEEFRPRARQLLEFVPLPEVSDGSCLTIST